MLEHPIPFDLDDIQRVRPLTYDNNTCQMYFEMRLNSEYEMLVTEEEIMTPIDVKPIISTDPTASTIFDANYNQAISQIKKEPEDQQFHSITS